MALKNLTIRIYQTTTCPCFQRDDGIVEFCMETVCQDIEVPQNGGGGGIRTALKVPAGLFTSLEPR